MHHKIVVNSFDRYQNPFDILTHIKPQTQEAVKKEDLLLALTTLKDTLTASLRAELSSANENLASSLRAEINTTTRNLTGLFRSELSSALSDFRVQFRQEMKEYMKQELTAFEVRLDIKLEKIELRIDNHARQYNSDIFTKFDSWAAALEKAQIDREISTENIKELQEDVKDHDRRLKKLESVKN